ncbi:MAG: prenyltransferase/squalene oxidase repeat-containing protein [bacterium]
MQIFRWLAVAGVMTALVAGVGRGADAADPVASARAAVARGLDWLQQNQATNGAWSKPQFPALTGLPLWAVCGAGDTNRQVMTDRAVAFLLSCVQTNGGIYAAVPGIKGGGLPNYNTAICMTALHATGRKDLTPVIRNARTFVGSLQYFGDDDYSGGFGYDRATGRAYTDLDNTFYALEAMRRTQDVEDSRPGAQKRVDVNWTAALAYVSKLQNKPAAGTNDAGGFFYNPDDAKAGKGTNAEGKVYLRSFGSITYAGLLSLIYANVTREDPRVASAVDFASRHWTLEENPGMGSQGLFFYYNVMARALATANMGALPRKAGGEPIAWRDELIRKIVSLQQPDGSWGNPNNRFWENDPVLVTSYCMLALEFAAGMTK